MEKIIKSDNRNIFTALLLLAAVKIGLHMSLYGDFSFFGDEYLFISCGQRLSLGYMDHPPFVSLLARFLELFKGANLFWFRLFPAVVGGVTLFFVGVLTRIFGGSFRAVCFSAFFYLTTPVLLRVHTKLSIAVLEQFALILFFCLLAQIVKQKKMKLFMGLFLVAAFSFWIKYSIIFWLAIFFLCLLFIKDYRFFLKSGYFYYGCGLFVLLVLPNVWWQMSFDFPIFDLFRSIKLLTSESVTYLSFLGGQIVYLHPFVFLISVFGLVYFFRSEEQVFIYRIFAYMSLGVFVFLFLQKAKVYYTTALFLPLIAGGSLYLDKLLIGPRKSFVVYLLCVFLFLTSVPFALPIFPVSASLDKYDKFLPFKDMKYDYLNRQSWEKLVLSVEAVYQSLNLSEQKDAYVFCAYATAAAALEYHLENKIYNPVISSHNDFYFWYDGKCTGNIIIAVGWPYKKLKEIFSEVELVPQAESRHFKQPEIYLCRNSKYSFNEVFKSLKH